MNLQQLFTGARACGQQISKRNVEFTCKKRFGSKKIFVPEPRRKEQHEENFSEPARDSTK